MCFTAWQSLVQECCHSSTQFVSEEQRIMVSSVAYMVHDVMAGRIKKHKQEKSSNDRDATQIVALEQTAKRLSESNVSLYRYGGFALHSLLQRYKGRTDSCSKDVMSFLKAMVIKPDEIKLLPDGIKLLDQGGLTIICPAMLPYLRVFIEKVAMTVSDEACCEYGKDMIDVARLTMEGDGTACKIFVDCIKKVGIDCEHNVLTQVNCQKNCLMLV